MKNTTKYAGLVAAALLAVAPAVAPAVQSTVAQGNGIAQAATSDVPYVKVDGTTYKDGASADKLLTTYDNGQSGDKNFRAFLSAMKDKFVTSGTVKAYYTDKNGNEKAATVDPAQFNYDYYNINQINDFDDEFGTVNTKGFTVGFTVVNPDTKDKATINVPVQVFDQNSAPSATGISQTPVYVKRGSTYSYSYGITFFENAKSSTSLGFDNNFVKVTNPVKTNTPGIYTVTYDVTNNANLYRQFTQKVVVTGDLAPKFSYAKGTNNTLTYNDGDTVSLNDADAKALTFKTGVKFSEIRDAILNLVSSKGNLSASYTEYNDTASNNTETKSANLTDQFSTSDVISDNIKDTSVDGNYTIPVVAKNADGDKVTIKVPVVVGNPSSLTQTNKSQVIYIKSGVTAQLYSDKATTQAISGRTLDASSAWQSPAVVTDASGKVVAYNLGGNQYVKASDVETTPQDNVSYQVKTQTIYVGNKSGAQLYSDPTATKAISGRTLDYASAWISPKEVYNNGTLVAYNLGGNQYVKAEDAVTTKPSGDQGQAVSGVFTISVPNHPTWGTAFYNDALQAKGILPAASKWRVFSIKTLSDGKQYYNLGGNQWIRADYGRLTK